ncbi:ChaN family lipoprotein [Marinifilum fragile]|uniref:ChaN family lipoprotein n=1 Tax=Marinifilum fragile TaxID=570161 RepID=UPI002AA945B8|nr:ChaN family lipoprotein [Marinifilum fragile]
MKHLTLILTIYLITINCKSQDTIVDYLKAVQQDFRTQERVFTDNVINNYDIVFIGEAHGFKDNSEIAYKLIKEYKELTDFTFLLGETDLAAADLLNSYLLSEDTIRLKQYVEDAKGTPAWNKENYEFYKNIIELNKNHNNKIQFLGIDIPAAGIDYTAQRIISIMSKYDESDSLMSSLVNVKVPTKQSIKHIKQMLEDSAKKNYSSVDLFEYKYHLNNIIQYHYAIQSNTDLEWDNRRDSCLYENYMKLDNQFALQNKKMIGVWGYEHTLQSTSLGVNYLASRLRKDALKKVYTYRIFYFDSESMFPATWLPWYLKIFKSKKKLYYNTKLQNDDISVAGYKPHATTLRDLSPEHSITIYNLTEEGSPFKYKPLLVTDNDLVGTTNFFQSAIVVRNSLPAEPFGENRK